MPTGRAETGHYSKKSCPKIYWDRGIFLRKKKFSSQVLAWGLADEKEGGWNRWFTGDLWSLFSGDLLHFVGWLRKFDVLPFRLRKMHYHAALYENIHCLDLNTSFDVCSNSTVAQSMLNASNLAKTHPGVLLTTHPNMFQSHWQVATCSKASA